MRDIDKHADAVRAVLRSDRAGAGAVSGGDWTIIIPDRMELARRLIAIMRVSERTPGDLQRFALDRGVPFSAGDWHQLVGGQRARIQLMSLSLLADFWQVTEAYFVALLDNDLAEQTLAAVEQQAIRDRSAFEKIMRDVADLPPASPPRRYRILRRLALPALRHRPTTH